MVWPCVPAAANAESVEPAETAPGPKLSIGGFVETFYQAHVQNPTNRVTNLRAFDNHSRTITLSNVAIDVRGETGALATRIALQFGHTPSTYYLAEPASPAGGSANASGSELWKYLLAANVTAKAPHGFVIEAGLFPSPIGPEAIPVKDNVHWSRSNLFSGLPFYHTGVMVSRPLGDGGWTGKLHVYNGWNSVVDNSAYPSVAASAAYASGDTTAQLLYFGGIERPTGAPEGNAWRNLFDAFVQHAVTDRLAIAAQGDLGVEPNDLGTSWWAAIAAYGKIALSPTLYAAVRGDYFYEQTDGAAPIFWPVEWVSSGTATLAYQPSNGISIRLEYRHDHAAGDAFFRGEVAGDGMTTPFVPDHDMQDTVTLGATAWF